MSTANFCQSPKAPPAHRRPSGISSPEQFKATLLAPKPAHEHKPAQLSHARDTDPIYIDGKYLTKYTTLPPNSRIYLVKYLADAAQKFGKTIAIAQTGLDYLIELEKFSIDVGWPYDNNEHEHVPPSPANKNDESAIALASPSLPAALASVYDSASSAELDRAVGKLKLSTSVTSSMTTVGASDSSPYSPESSISSPRLSTAATSFEGGTTPIDDRRDTYADAHAGAAKGKDVCVDDIVSSHTEENDRGDIFGRPHNAKLCVLLCCDPGDTPLKDSKKHIPHGVKFDQSAWNHYIAKYKEELRVFKRFDFVDMVHAHRYYFVALKEWQMDGYRLPVNVPFSENWPRYMNSLFNKYDEIEDKVRDLKVPDLESTIASRKILGLPV
ncbi:hypothetical protein KVT40_004727 [Elsinoe batatas]|uniref:Uncharacterized protein n=1 Tax=Elsinoe batatas TaxID=2601811 RepID=A0A8K0L064_9PEZI|nr:hypothetical protein KVT40_004727 [Elsinoe batatas]